MTGPRRIQRKRTKGWRMPPNTVYVGRPTKWGNPFGNAKAYAISVAPGYLGATMRFRDEIRRELRGKNLACWCPLDKPCHADVLLQIANGDQDREAGE